MISNPIESFLCQQYQQALPAIAIIEAELEQIEESYSDDTDILSEISMAIGEETPTQYGVMMADEDENMGSTAEQF